MPTLSLAPHPGLRDGSRLRWLSSPSVPSEASEIAFLASCGFVAAVASGYFDFRLRIPGHAILRAIFPMVLGLAVVPRRGAGTVMGTAALATGLGLRALFPAGGLSLGALTSLTLVGPALDLSLRHAHVGWRLYAGCAAAGLAANIMAFATRGGAKLLGWERLGARPWSDWLVHASFSYVVCGILAGLISGMIWFQATSPPSDRSRRAAEHKQSKERDT